MIVRQPDRARGIPTGGPAPTAPGFLYNYERANFNPAGSSITAGAGIGGSLLIVMNPELSQSQTNGTAWMNLGVDLVGMLGQRPTFRTLQASAHNYAGYVAGTKCWMYSYDSGENWLYFTASNTKDVANDWITWQNGTAFTQDTVRVAEYRQMSVHSHGQRIAALAATYSFIAPTPSALAYTPTSNVSDYAAQAFICNEYSAQVTLLSRTVPISPLYGFQINDTSIMPVSGPKKLWLINGCTHSGEDMGDFSMWLLINWLCGSTTEAILLRRNFRIIIRPATTAQGRCGGSYRGIFGGGSDDPNRNMDLNNMQAVTFLKAADATDFAGAPLKIMFDYHGTYNGRWEVTAGSNTVDTNFKNKLATLSGYTVADLGAQAASRKSGWYHSSASDGFAGAVLSTTLEHGDASGPVSDADLLVWAQSIGIATYQMWNEGVFA
jgi:hypothetical protein